MADGQAVCMLVALNLPVPLSRDLAEADVEERLIVAEMICAALGN